MREGILGPPGQIRAKLETIGIDCDQLSSNRLMNLCVLIQDEKSASFEAGYSAASAAQAKAEKAPDAHPYAWAIKGPGIKAEKGEIHNPGADLVDPEENVRSAARREAFEALRGIMKDGDNHDRILACRVALETNQW